jgi:hypothetical protein
VGGLCHDFVGKYPGNCHIFWSLYFGIILMPVTIDKILGKPLVKIVETVPTDSTKLNASYVLSYNAGGELVRVVKTVGATNYTKNIVPLSADTTITQTVTVGAWS